MRQVIIENTDVAVSRISFGTGSLHHAYFGLQRQALIAAAASAGITHFDTSPYYGYGLAESELGRFLTGQRGAFTLTTKVGLYSKGAAASAAAVWGRKAVGRLIPSVALPIVNWRVDQARASLRRSLKRLRTDYVDFLMLHEPDSTLVRADEFLSWLEAERALGSVRFWGVAGLPSNVSEWVAARHPLAAVVQTQDSLARREADFLSRNYRKMQFTYGYLSGGGVEAAPYDPGVILHNAMKRNDTGSVIVSTRQLNRMCVFAEALADGG